MPVQCVFLHINTETNNRNIEKNIKFMLAPHAIYTCDREYLLKISEEAKRLNLGLNIHLSESKAEFNDCMRDNGCTPTEYVASLGLFEEGIGLVKLCNKRLDAAEQKVKILTEQGGKKDEKDFDGTEE